jgi:hypothetical protein
VRDANVVWIVFLAFAVLAPDAFGGSGSLRGDEPDTWNKEGGYSVVVARLTDIRKQPAGSANGTHVGRLEPLVVLAGTLDPTSISFLNVDIVVSGATSSVTSLPEDGSLVLTVVLWRTHTDSADRVPDRAPMVATASCEFMPGRSALVPITGLDDPNVEQTLVRLRRARAGRGATAPTSSTQPAPRG